jgi:hypothetical protein
VKVRLRVLPDELRGGAWPSPVRAVRCPVKSGNERDPYHQLPSNPVGVASTLVGLPSIRRRKEGATAGQYAPNPSGYTRPAMVGTIGLDPERGR